MANCDSCGEEPQAVQVGNMETGEQLFLGVACAARWGLDFAKTILSPEEIAQQIGPMFVTPAREDLHDAHEATKSRKGRKTKAQEPAPAQDPPGAAVEGGEG